MYTRQLHHGRLPRHCKSPGRYVQPTARVENGHPLRILDNRVRDSMRVRGAEVCDKAAHQAREE